jgi:hypothetical protein
MEHWQCIRPCDNVRPCDKVPGEMVKPLKEVKKANVDLKRAEEAMNLDLKSMDMRCLWAWMV